jgi:3-methyladenine DNA glycosylase AlkD
MKSEIIIAIRSDLMAQANEADRLQAQHYFKEPVKTYGVKTGPVGEIAAARFKEIKALGKAQVFALCEELLKSGFIEESFIACEWVYRVRRDFLPADFAVFEKWLSRYVNNWATCDTLCNHSVAAFIEMYPDFLSGLKSWTKNENRWCRRAAAVSLILPARNGKFLPDIFEIAGILLLDKDDLVQKGYGWMLKEASKKHLDEVFEFVMANKAVMPRTALRYAIEKMPADMKARAMAPAK